MTTDEDGLVEAVSTRPANESEMTNFGDILDEAAIKKEKRILYDKGADSEKNRKELRSRGLKDWVMRKKPIRKGDVLLVKGQKPFDLQTTLCNRTHIWDDQESLRNGSGTVYRNSESSGGVGAEIYRLQFETRVKPLQEVTAELCLKPEDGKKSVRETA